jgi:D-2-hydroxyacid dehydrogenase (NADP+)
MEIVIIQNTNKEFWPAFKIKKEHLFAINNSFSKVQVRVINDKDVDQKKIAEVEVIITTPFFLEELSKIATPKLKWIQLTSAGVDRLPEKIKNSDTVITNASGVHPVPISEHVFAFILMFARGMHISYRNQIERKNWTRSFQKFNPTELPGKTLGIVGLGNIGKEVARLGQLFEMRVLTVTTKKGNLIKLLKESDFIVDCLPATAGTYKYFDKFKFSKMKKGTFFINIGRGKTVNEKALVDALESKLGGAGLDVTETEPLPKTSPFWKLENVIITPHVSGWTPEYMNRVIAIFCINLKAYLKGEKMPNLVDKDKGY